MRRADRLFEIIQLLRSRQLTTAKWLSARLEISERTVYRDIQDLISCGVPIEGAAGVGYILHKDYDLPPLMFNLAEVTSLIIGIKMATSLGGKVAEHAEQALSKIDDVLPKDLKRSFRDTHIYTPPFYEHEPIGSLILQLNHAIQSNLATEIHYQKINQESVAIRTIYPLGIFFWKNRWTLAAWCTLRDNFRHFRIDRIRQIVSSDHPFILKKHQTLNAFFKQVSAETIN